MRWCGGAESGYKDDDDDPEPKPDDWVPRSEEQAQTRGFEIEEEILEAEGVMVQ